MKVKLLTLAGLAVAYLLAAQFGLALQPSGTAAAWPFWPPAGLGLAAVLWLGWQAWPGVLLGAFVAGLAGPAARPGAPLVVAALCAGAAIGSTLEALAGAWLVRRFAGGRAALERPQAVFWFVALGALLSAIIGPTLRLGSFWLAGLAKGQEASNLWWAWWRAEAVGVVLVAPWLMALGQGPVRALDRKRLIEFLALEALLVLLCLAIFEGEFVPQTGHGLRSYLLMPILLWPALRFGQAGTTTSLIVLSSLAAIGTARGLGPFAGGDWTLSMLTLQGFIGVSAVMALVLAADATQQERTEGQLRASEQRLERRVGERTALLQAANKELEAFAYSVSHDLRAPLRSMLGFSQILLERHRSQLDANCQDLLRRACESCRQMDGLIEDLLNLSRVGRSEILRRPVNLSAMASKSPPNCAPRSRPAPPNSSLRPISAPRATSACCASPCRTS